MEGESICNNTFSVSNCSNTTNDFPVYDSTVEAILIPVTFSIIFLIGIIGNGVLLVFMIRRRRMTSPHNIYVTSLAVGDLMMISISMPFMSTIYTFESWQYGEIICKLSECFHTLCTSGTVYMLTTLSIERYILITAKRSEHRKCMSVIVVFVVWVYSFMFAVPDLISANVDGPAGYEICLVYRQSWGDSYAKTMTIQKLLFLFVIPVTVTIPFYIMIIVKILRSTLNQTYIGDRPKTKAERHKVRMVALTFVLIVVFVLSWLPRHVFLMWFYFDPSPYNIQWHILKVVGFCLMYANSAFNPLVFFILDPGIREFVSFCKIHRRQEYSPVNGKCEEEEENTIVLTELTHINNHGSMV